MSAWLGEVPYREVDKGREGEGEEEKQWREGR